MVLECRISSHRVPCKSFCCRVSTKSCPAVCGCPFGAAALSTRPEPSRCHRPPRHRRRDVTTGYFSSTRGFSRPGLTSGAPSRVFPLRCSRTTLVGRNGDWLRLARRIDTPYQSGSFPPLARSRIVHALCVVSTRQRGVSLVLYNSSIRNGSRVHGARRRAQPLQPRSVRL